ncbi:DUF6950 family protein [Chelativorans sp.]|uniref:DUF6950 family protein n=1 Tax=Chelativorans sp. TaxID=2203393 RepID=UPI002810B55D|nr:hypothetical protein [Chelativorans sp.]
MEISSSAIRRLPDWRGRLFAYVEEVARKPFTWGHHDCALFAAGAVEAMTGHDIAAPFRARYKTLPGGMRLLKRKGSRDHAEYAASIFEEIHPSHAQVGDLAAIDDDGHIALGVVQGARIYVLRPEARGIGTVELLHAARAFRVPFATT